jgi:hypothetical protein
VNADCKETFSQLCKPDSLSPLFLALISYMFLYNGISHRLYLPAFNFLSPDNQFIMNPPCTTTTVRLSYLQALCTALKACGGYDEDMQWIKKNYIQPHNGKSCIETEAISYFTRMAPLTRRLYLEYPSYRKDFRHEMKEQEGDMAGNDDAEDTKSRTFKQGEL